MFFVAYVVKYYHAALATLVVEAVRYHCAIIFRYVLENSAKFYKDVLLGKVGDVQVN